MGKIIITYLNGTLKEVEYDRLDAIAQLGSYGEVLQVNYNTNGQNVQKYFSMGNLISLELVPYPVGV